MPRNSKKQTVRIIGGQWRSRRLQFPDIPGLRPTQDRVRETVFNWLAPYLVGARCLDLFAGTGALGFEALSRGAQFSCFVDNHPKALAALKVNGEKLKIDSQQYAIIKGSCPASMPPLPKAPFQIVFLDPPFGEQLIMPTIEWLNRSSYLSSNTWIYLEKEIASAVTLPPHWQVYREHKSRSLIYQLIIQQRLDSSSPISV